MKGNSRMNCKNAKKLTVFFLIEHLNGNINLVVGISAMTFEHIFINLILSDLEVWPTGTFRPFS